jgi:hypothetical protein
VDLIHDYNTQTPEESFPLNMIRQESQMKHVRIGDDQVRQIVLDAAAFPWTGVSVVYGGSQSVFCW